MLRLEPESVHCLNGLSLPVRYDLGVEFIKPEMLADIEVEIIFIPLITEQCVGP